MKLSPKDTRIPLWSLTYDEYLDIVDPRREHHPSSAYNVDLERMNQFVTPEKIEKQQLVNTLTINNRLFELRVEIRDHQKEEHHQWDYENDTWARDENNNLIPLTQEEKELKFTGLKRYEYDFHVYDKHTGKKVATTSDEWGCILIQTAEEFRGMGLGALVLDKLTEKYPFKSTGGATDAGNYTSYKVHQSKVAKAFANGSFSKMYKEGNITFQKVLNIAKSVGLHNSFTQKFAEKVDPMYRHEYTKRKQRTGKYEKYKDLSPTCKTPVFYIDNATVVAFNESAYEKIRDDDLPELFRNELIQGYTYIGGVYLPDSLPYLFGEFYQDDKARKACLAIALTRQFTHKENVCVDAEQKEFIEQAFPEMTRSTPMHGRRGYFEMEILKEIIPEKVIKIMQLVEKTKTLKADPYGEIRDAIHELGYALSEEVRLKEHEHSNSY